MCDTFVKIWLLPPDIRDLLSTPKEAYDLNLSAVTWEFGHFEPQHRFFVPKNFTILVCCHPLTWACSSTTPDNFWIGESHSKISMQIELSRLDSIFEPNKIEFSQLNSIWGKSEFGRVSASWGELERVGASLSERALKLSSSTRVPETKMLMITFWVAALMKLDSSDLKVCHFPLQSFQVPFKVLFDEVIFVQCIRL